MLVIITVDSATISTNVKVLNNVFAMVFAMTSGGCGHMFMSKSTKLTVWIKIMVGVENNKLTGWMSSFCKYFRRLSGIGTMSAMLYCLLLAACTTIEPAFSSTETASVDRLLLLMQSRLDLAPDVAKNKWNTKSAIEDLPREKVIVDSLAAQAVQYGLAEPQVKRFFQAQIEGSKVIQTALFAKWEVSGQKNFSGMPDLAKDIRPALDKMTPDMLMQLKDVLPVLSKAGADRLVAQQARAIASDAPGFEKAWRIALEPLIEAGNSRRDQH